MDYNAEFGPKLISFEDHLGTIITKAHINENNNIFYLKHNKYELQRISKDRTEQSPRRD